MAAERAGKLDILFEDDWIVAISKGAGLLSVGFPGYRGKTAQDILADRYRNRGNVQIYAVHRLDRETSGVMIFAKSAEARDRFMDGWQEIVSERTYRCVCRRELRAAPLPDSLTVDEPIAYNIKNVGFVPRKEDRAARESAERAVTRIKVLERGESLDLVECELETGRKNQIRVHLAHLGHPILGDPVYGNRIPGEKAQGFDRLALHARVIAFTHPFTGDFQRFEVKESGDFARAVRRSRSEARRGEAIQPPAGREAKERSGAKKTAGIGETNARSGRSSRYANGSKFIPGK